MRVFEKPTENFTCPICGTSEEKPVTLVTIDGTQENNIAEARQYHIDCIDLVEVTATGADRVLHTLLVSQNINLIKKE